MGLGKIIILSGVATMFAVHAHALMACELDQAPKRAAEALRKPARLVQVERFRIKRPDIVYPSVRSRRIILQ